MLSSAYASESITVRIAYAANECVRLQNPTNVKIVREENRIQKKTRGAATHCACFKCVRYVLPAQWQWTTSCWRWQKPVVSARGQPRPSA